MKKDVLLLGFSFVTYMERQDHISEDGKYMQFADDVQKAISNLASEYGLDLDCASSSLYAVGGGLKPDNSGRCAICNEWVSAQNKDNIIAGLGVGAQYNDKLYCSKHLPKESPMYKKLYPA